MPHTKTITTLRAIADPAKNAGRGLTPGELRDFHEAEAEHLAATGVRYRDGAPLERLARYQAEDRYARAFATWLRNGDREGLLAPAFGVRAVTPTGSTPAEERALSSITGNLGGFAVPEGFASQVMVAQDFVSGLAPLASTVVTDNGADLPWPTVDATSEVGELISESAEVSEGTDSDLGRSTLKGWSFTSKWVKVAWQLLEDEAVGLEAHIAARLGKRLGRAQAPYFVAGRGSRPTSRWASPPASRSAPPPPAPTA